MSIWCSWPVIGFDDWPDDEPQPRGGQVRSYATGWSNHYPTTSGHVERKASIDLASTPVWCVPGHWEEFDDRVGPWLRLGVDSWSHVYESGGRQISGPERASVVMDEDAVRQLVADLTDWLDHPKAHPTPEGLAENKRQLKRLRDRQYRQRKKQGIQ